MRLTEAKIQSLADQVYDVLAKSDQVTFIAGSNQIAFRIKAAITDDLRREDQLDQEVTQILEAALRGKNRMSIDYQSLFKKAKASLIRERKLVI
ncbi:MAG: DUF507 family protein [Candidatus Sumerlaeia bacterium]|nr:DUF507 family protein [Candidatus Sumerlaeia bacterium]